MTSLRSALALGALVALAGCAVPMPPAAPPAPAAPESEAAPAPEAPPPSASSDQEFVNTALGLGQAEIGMGRLAHGKGASKAVRGFAEQMVLAHTVANRHVTLVAKHLRLEIAPPPDEPPPALLASVGPDFDKQYLDLVIAAHRNMIALFENEANNGQHPNLKHAAKTLLPELRYHLRAAEALAHKGV